MLELLYDLLGQIDEVGEVMLAGPFLQDAFDCGGPDQD